MRPPFERFRRDFRKHPAQARTDQEFIDRCMRAWDAGMNSREIAIKFMQPEASIEVALWSGREARRKAATDAEWATGPWVD